MGLWVIITQSRLLSASNFDLDMNIAHVHVHVCTVMYVHVLFTAVHLHDALVAYVLQVSDDEDARDVDRLPFTSLFSHSGTDSPLRTDSDIPPVREHVHVHVHLYVHVHVHVGHHAHIGFHVARRVVDTCTCFLLTMQCTIFLQGQKVISDFYDDFRTPKCCCLHWILLIFS